MQEAQARPFKQTSPWVFPDVWVIFKILSIHTRSYITIPFQFSFFFFFFFLRIATREGATIISINYSKIIF